MKMMNEMYWVSDAKMRTESHFVLLKWFNESQCDQEALWMKIMSEAWTSTETI